MMILHSLLPFLLLSSSLTQGQNTQEFGNAEYTVSAKVKANQPRYYYWANNDPNKSKYRVAFSKIYESKGGNKVGGSNLALASIDWTITQDTAITDSVVFWVNGTTTGKGNSNKSRFTVLSFRNEIVNNSVKFDVILDNYSWVDTTADTLDLEWKMTNSTGPDTDTDEDPVRERYLRDKVMGRSLVDDLPVSDTANLICWYGAGGDAENQICWKIVAEAQAVPATGGSSTPVPVTLDLDGGFIKISYTNWGFDGSLFHDPEYGYILGTNFTAQDCAAWGLLSFICYIISFFLSLLGF